MNTAVITAIDAVEIKVTIRPGQEPRAERTMEANENTADVRLLYFYDTPDLDLFKAGLVLRARLVKGGADESTVKIRPVEPADVARDWRRVKGFKLESDWVGDRSSGAKLTRLQKGSVPSASCSPTTRSASWESSTTDGSSSENYAS
jgi:hypothetical protein